MNNLLLKEKIFETIKKDVDINNFIDFDINGFYVTQPYLINYISKSKDKAQTLQELIDNNILSELNKKNYKYLKEYLYKDETLKEILDCNIQNIYHFEIKDEFNNLNILKKLSHNNNGVLEKNYKNDWIKKYIEKIINTLNDTVKQEIKTNYEISLHMVSDNCKQNEKIDKLLNFSNLFFTEDETINFNIDLFYKKLNKNINDRQTINKDNLLFFLEKTKFFNSPNNFFQKLHAVIKKNNLNENLNIADNYKLINQKVIDITDEFSNLLIRNLNKDALMSLNNIFDKESKPKISSKIKSYFKSYSTILDISITLFLTTTFCTALLLLYFPPLGAVTLFVSLLSALPMIDKEERGNFIKSKKEALNFYDNDKTQSLYKKHIAKNIKYFFEKQNEKIKDLSVLPSLENAFSIKENIKENFDNVNKEIVKELTSLDNKKEMPLKPKNQNNEVLINFKNFIKTLPLSSKEFLKLENILSKDDNIIETPSFSSFIETSKEILSLNFKEEDKNKIDNDLKDIISKYNNELEEQFLSDFDKKKTKLQILKKSIGV